MVTSTTADVRQRILDKAKPIMLQRGFAGVGLNEILQSAGVPKGSFYHYFGSKEAFGEALLAAYFADYLRQLDTVLSEPGQPAAERLLRYWKTWWDDGGLEVIQSDCLVVKLGAEVCDWSPAMQTAIKQGTAQVVMRLADCIGEGLRDGSLSGIADPRAMASTLYQLWLGTALLGKFRQDAEPFELAMAATRTLLNMSAV